MNDNDKQAFIRALGGRGITFVARLPGGVQQEWRMTLRDDGWVDLTVPSGDTYQITRTDALELWRNHHVPQEELGLPQTCCSCGARVYATYPSPLDRWHGDRYPRYVCEACANEQARQLREDAAEARREQDDRRAAGYPF